jgi:CheY-like chemotaxis protein
MIEFYVQDSGIGIAPEVQQEIFELFRQVDYSNTRKFGGSGLGLTISKAYVEMLGGEIWLYSERNGGTVFYFTIPYKFASQSNKSASISFDKGDYLGPEKVILVVEDEINNFKLIKEILRKSHIELIYAENGIEAIECCKNRNDIDLILMDIMMPVMGGYEASAEIRKFYRNIPIVAQTAYVLDFDQQHALECGITDYISKPFKRTEFLHRVKNLISQVVV